MRQMAPFLPAFLPVVALTLLGASSPQTPAKPATKALSSAKSHVSIVAPYNFALTRLDGAPTTLGAYQGRVLLIVNTASKCGYTPQYAGLQKLHETYAKRGLAVLGFPSNDFLWQEPGTAKEIATFCQQDYGVTFDMFDKVELSGKRQAPLFGWLIERTNSLPERGAVRWNFEKFLLDRHGAVVGRFRSKTTPESPELVGAIETALKAK